MIMSDVIEHFEKQEGLKQLRRAANHLTPGGLLMLSTPAVFCKQGSVHGNELETHRSLWAPEDLTQLGFEIVWDGSPDVYRHRMLVGKFEKKPPKV
jgi:predicted SAM-dependent methyltransferase